MPRILLTEHAPEARVPMALLEARAFVAPPLVPVSAVAIDAAGDPVAAPLAAPPPGVAVVAADRIDGTTVRVEASPAFPAESTVTLLLTIGSSSVQVGPLQSAGLAAQDVVDLEVDGDEVVVRVAVADDELVELSTTGELARAAAAAELGVARVSVQHRCAVTVLVDGSASFRALAEDDVRLALDLVAGVTAVVGMRDVELVVSGVTPTHVVERDLAAFGASALAAIAAAPRSSGSRFASSVAVAAQSPRRLPQTWIVSDSVPTDAAVVRAARRGGAVGVIVIGDPSTSSTVVDGAVPVTWIAAGSPPADESVVARLVHDLLRGTRAAQLRDAGEATA